MINRRRHRHGHMVTFYTWPPCSFVHYSCIILVTLMKLIFAMIFRMMFPMIFPMIFVDRTNDWIIMIGSSCDADIGYLHDLNKEGDFAIQRTETRVHVV